ncbi:actin-histidine N-methyltransferase [Clupea harengus]|uniref:protein-histidine N-methyltransferase n=1 Tax=Clupea harengus TaxID=7950 RepID=A0A6P8GNK9_CLUHA|nr:actin-histidine N-methyltransferase [Clupea harengus]
MVLGCGGTTQVDMMVLRGGGTTQVDMMVLGGGGTTQVDMMVLGCGGTRQVDMMVLGCGGTTQVDMMVLGGGGTTQVDMMVLGCGGTTQVDMMVLGGGGTTQVDMMVLGGGGTTQVDMMVLGCGGTTQVDMMVLGGGGESCTHPNASKLPLKDAFTFDDYRWAVSSVMTRQNQIPTEDGSRVTLALIPLWDMCNHTNGLITTGYNLEDDRCECVALQDYKENQQIYIFYGTRSNAEFVIHNGFFFEDNAHDRVKIKLGVSKSERLYAMKAEVLARAGIPSSSIFALHCSDPPISAQLLAFLRVFCMTEEELKDYLVGEHAINKIFTLGNTEFPVSWDNEIKLWTFLETRASLLLKTYKTTSEEDRTMLEKPDLSLHSRTAIKLRLAEKEILERAASSGRAKRLHFQQQLDEGAALPLYEESDIALLENADAKLPIILRKLEEEEEDDDEERSAEKELKMAQGDAIGVPLLNGERKPTVGPDPMSQLEEKEKGEKGELEEKEKGELEEKEKGELEEKEEKEKDIKSF